VVVEGEVAVGVVGAFVTTSTQDGRDVRSPAVARHGNVRPPVGLDAACPVTITHRASFMARRANARPVSPGHPPSYPALPPLSPRRRCGPASSPHVPAAPPAPPQPRTQILNRTPQKHPSANHMDYFQFSFSIYYSPYLPHISVPQSSVPHPSVLIPHNFAPPLPALWAIWRPLLPAVIRAE